MTNKFGAIFAAAMFMAAFLLPACGGAGGPDPCVGEGCTLPDAGDESDTLQSDLHTDGGDLLGQDTLPDTTPTDPCADFMPVYEESIARIYWACNGSPCEFPPPITSRYDPNRCVMNCVGGFWCDVGTIVLTDTPGSGITSFTCTTTSGTPENCRR